jgi:PAS domain S-box-containing protein
MKARGRGCGVTTYNAFFHGHPDPMWIYDCETLRFLEVNAAAIAHYGWTADEFSAMTIEDIRPAEDLPDLREHLAARAPGLEASGIWRHLCRDGSEILVDVRAQEIDYLGRRCRLVNARDVTKLVALEVENHRLVEREQRARQEAEDAAEKYQALFEAAPGNVLVLDAEDFRVVAASDNFLRNTWGARRYMLGQPVFEALAPDMEDAADGRQAVLAKLRASFEHVRRTGVGDALAVEAFPIRRPAHLGGGKEERFWSGTSTPVKDKKGEVRFIILRLEDVTEFVRSRAEQGGEAQARRQLEDRATHLEIDIILRARELEQANRELREREAMLREAEKVANFGSWAIDMDSGEVRWSDHLYRIAGVRRKHFGHRIEDVLALIHPDDRETFQALRRSAIEDGAPFDRVFRMLRPDGELRYIRQIGALRKRSGRRILSGIVQDVTELHQAERRAEEVTLLMRIAERTARVGGWRVDLANRRIGWSDELARIYELEPGDAPDFDRAIQYTAPEFRERVVTVIRACIEQGVPFDENIEALTATGRRLQVRLIGEPERDENGKVGAIAGALQDVSELVAAREASERLSRRLVETLENINDAFYLLDPSWRFAFVNREASRLLGRDVAELLGRRGSEAFPEAAGSRIERIFLYAVKQGKAVDFTEYYRPLGRWFSGRAHPSREGVAVYFRDVTEERSNEQQLRLLESAVSRLNDIVLITEADPIDEPGPRIVYVNDAFEKITGYRRDEVMGRSPRFLQGPASDRVALDRLRRALRAREPVRTELLNYSKNGVPFWSEIDIVPIANASGWYTHWVSVQRDITERHAAEQALRESEERLRLVAATSKDVIWDWDAETGEIWWNEGLRRHFGYEPEDFGSRTEDWMARVHPEDRMRVRDTLDVALRDGEGHWRAEYRFLRADGEYARVLDEGGVLRDGDGAPRRMLGTMTDVTEMRKLEEQLQQAQRMDAIGQLTGGVAHDFNNLLTVILGNAEMLAESLSEEAPLRKLAEMTRSAAERGAELTNRLLAFARRQTLDPEPTDIGRLVTGMDSLLRRTLGEHVRIVMSGMADLWPALVDPSQLENALLNLCINARDAMAGGGVLSIEACNTTLDASDAGAWQDLAPGDYIMIAVSDTGAGMDKATAERAFEPFFTTKGTGHGSGLGLSMVYGFVKQSRGHLRLYSEPGHGTVIRLYLPRANGRQPCRDLLETEQTIPRGSERVLVVEDDDLVRGHVTAQLAELGYQVFEASSGPDALRNLDEHPEIDLLFTDIVMPGGLNGHELAHRARERLPGLPVLFTSGYTENVIGCDGSLEPGVQLLNKPYSRMQLAHKLREALLESGYSLD